MVCQTQLSTPPTRMKFKEFLGGPGPSQGSVQGSLQGKRQDLLHQKNGPPLTTVPNTPQAPSKEIIVPKITSSKI